MEPLLAGSIPAIELLYVSYKFVMLVLFMFNSCPAE